MNYPTFLTVPRRQSVVTLATLLGILCSQRGAVAADPAEAFRQQKAVAGRVALLPPGFLLHRQGEDKSWHLLTPGTDVAPEDLVVGVPFGFIDSTNRNVRLTLLSDLARISPYPVLESAVVLHETDLDLDFTLERGRVDLANRRRTGESKVRVRFQKQTWELTLGDKAKVAFELFGRWPAGMHFSRTPKPDETPTIDVVMIVKEGQVGLKAGGKEFAMSSPPGVAYYHWDSVPPFDEGPRWLDSLPSWGKAISQMPSNAGDFASLIKVIVNRSKERPTSIEEALATILTEDSVSGRRIAVYGLGALDDLPRLIDALSSSKFPDVRDVSVIALRHWIGRGEGQDRKLYDALIQKGYSVRHATAFMQLLHSFGDSAKASPATYETLIELLAHENPAIRQLANWHLVRLVSVGKDINYDPLAAPEERQKAAAKWKELIPAGKLPPRQ